MTHGMMPLSGKLKVVVEWIRNPLNQLQGDKWQEGDQNESFFSTFGAETGSRGWRA